MSIYRRGKTWWFSFRYKNRRFRKSTFTTDKALAERIEARARLEAAEQSSFPQKKEMSLAEAMLKYWNDHAQYLNSAYTIDRQIEKLRDLDDSTLLSEIDDPTLADRIAKRRGQNARNKKTLVSSSTVNGEIRTLRAIMNRARDNWGVRIGKVSWRSHMLTENADRRRYLTADEQARVLACARPDFRPIVEFCLLSGARFAKAQGLTWSDIDHQSGKITFRNMKGRRRGKSHSIPMSSALRALIASQKGNHPIYVFTYQCKENRPSKVNGAVRIKGEHYPFSRDGWRRVWKRALKDAGVADFRFHDTRHTALSRITRHSGLAVAGKLADHKDAKTTLRYAHVLDDDVLNALEGVHKSGHTNSSETQQVIVSKKEKA